MAPGHGYGSLCGVTPQVSRHAADSARAPAGSAARLRGGSVTTLAPKLTLASYSVDCQVRSVTHPGRAETDATVISKTDANVIFSKNLPAGIQTLPWPAETDVSVIFAKRNGASWR